VGINKKIWVFGDSFSTSFDKFQKIYCPTVVEYLNDKGSIPMCYGEILSAKLGLVLKNEATSGASNQTIFHSFISRMDLIQDEDIIIIGWSHVQRFRVSELSNRFCDVKISDKVPKYLEGMFEQDALNQLIINRDTNDIFFTEIIDYIKVINRLFPNKKVYNWTWVEPVFSKGRIHEKLYYNNLSIPYKPYTTISKETNSKYNDIHYGETGHQELSKDLLNIIIKKFI
jgi:hypothetical protein